MQFLGSRLQSASQGRSGSPQARPMDTLLNLTELSNIFLAQSSTVTTSAFPAMVGHPAFSS